jgi:esterase/lipase
MKQKKITIQEILKILELPSNVWQLHNQTTYENACKFMDDFKKLAKKQQHKLVKKYHPDLIKNGKEEESKLKEINSAIDIIMKITINRQVQRPRVVIFRSFNSFTSTNNTSTSTYYTYS